VIKRQGQHFLLSAKARSLSLMEIFNLSADEAFEMFRMAGWSDTQGEAGGSCHNHLLLNL
jgi:hypothetical protein